MTQEQEYSCTSGSVRKIATCIMWLKFLFIFEVFEDPIIPKAYVNKTHEMVKTLPSHPVNLV